MKPLVLGLVGLLGVMGCDSPSPQAAAPSASTSAPSTTSSAGPTTGLPYADERLPDQADFVAEADQEITRENFDAKLRELEEEISKAEQRQDEAMAAPASPAPPPAATSAPTAVPSASRP
jgi:hypothetical protein